MCQEVKVNIMCDFLQVFEDLVSLQTSSFLVLDDQTRQVSLSWRLWHLSQAGWSHSGLIFTPGKLSSISSCRFRLRTTPSHGTLIPRAPTLFGEHLLYVKILLLHYFMLNFLYLLVQILWKYRPEIQKIQVLRSFTDAKIGMNISGLSRL